MLLGGLCQESRRAVHWRIDGWLDGWMDGWMDVWIELWIDGLIGLDGGWIRSWKTSVAQLPYLVREHYLADPTRASM
jgi:hypothetical protein